jgi:hypothetical protein
MSILRKHTLRRTSEYSSQRIADIRSGKVKVHEGTLEEQVAHLTADFALLMHYVAELHIAVEPLLAQIEEQENKQR